MCDTVNFDVARTFARVARDLTDQPDAASVAQRIVSIGVNVTGSSSVALFRFAADHVPAVLATSDDVISTVDRRATRSTGEGPLAQAGTARVAVFSDDLSTETRWPGYRAPILQLTAVRAVLAVPLRAGGSDCGVLMFYADQAGYFTDELRQLAAVLAEHAAVALVYAAARDQAEHFTLALRSNREIGAAVGILIERHKITEADAFEMLRARSQHLNIKLHLVALALTSEGELPAMPAAATPEGQAVSVLTDSAEHRRATRAMSRPRLAS